MTLRRQRLAFFSVLALGVAAVVASCYDPRDTHPTANPLDVGQTVEKLQFQIVPGALNIGCLVVNGRDDPFGAFLAAEQITAAGGIGGKPVNIVYMDSTDYPGGAQQTKIDAMIDAGLPVILTAEGDVTLATLAEAQSLGQPVLSVASGSTSTILTTAARAPDTLFRTCPSFEFEAATLARATFDSVTQTARPLVRTPTAIALFQDDDADVAAATAFMAAFTAIHGHAVAVSFTADQSGLTNDAIDAALHRAFDGLEINSERVVLFAEATPDPASTVLREWLRIFVTNTLNVTSPWVFPDELSIRFLTDNLPGGLRGAIGDPTNGTLCCQLSKGIGPGFAQFKADYGARYNGKSVEPFVASAYDAVALISLAAAHALVVSGTANPTGAEIAAAMRSVANGAPGAVTCSAGVANLARGIQALEAGQPIRYLGAYSQFAFDANGDIHGPAAAAFTVVRYDGPTKKFDTKPRTVVVSIP